MLLSEKRLVVMWDKYKVVNMYEKLICGVTADQPSLRSVGARPLADQDPHEPKEWDDRQIGRYLTVG